MKHKKVIVLMVFILILTSCSKKDETWADSFNLGETFESLLSSTDLIVIDSGAGNGSLQISDHEKISTLCAYLSDLNCEIDENQEERVGWIYRFTIYDSKDKKELIIVIGENQMSDNILENHSLDLKSPYYIFENSEDLIQYVETLF